MMNKADLINRIKELIKEEDVEAVNAEINETADAFLELHEKESNENNPEATASDERTEAQPLAPEPHIEKEEDVPAPPDPLFQEFNTLMKRFKEKKAQFFRARAEKETKNLNAKKELIQRLNSLVSEEENIGKAFGELKAIQEKWNETGSVPRKASHDIQQEYSNAVEQFYYNINIYKDLKEHDFSRNLQHKEEVIEKLKKLLKLKSIKETEKKLRALQNEWEGIGVTRKEDWERVKNQYWDVVRSIYQKISDHYEGRKRERAENLKAKEGLIEELKPIVAKADETEKHKDWSKIKSQVLELQKKWKAIGAVPKDDNKRIWGEFRQLCDDFFGKRSAFYEERNENFDQIKEQKEQLINEVKEINQNSEWRETAERIKKIQKKWQELGNSGPKYEQKLWKAFRSACDQFFTRRDEHFAQKDKEEAENLKNKEELLKKIEAHQPDPNKAEESTEKLNDFAQQFAAIGEVPRKNQKALLTRYNKLMDGHYKKVGVSDQEVDKVRFEARLDGIKNSKDADQKIEQERKKIKRQIKELQHEIAQYETNLSFFTSKSKGENPLMDAAKKNLEDAQQKVEDLKKRLKSL